MIETRQQFYHVSRKGALTNDLELSKDFTKFHVDKKDIHFSNGELIKSLEAYFPDGISQ